MPEASTNFEVIVPAAKFFAEPSRISSIETELLFGEYLEVTTDCGEFCCVRSERYSTPGYVLKNGIARRELHRRSVGHTHRVSVPHANIYLKPYFKWPDPDNTFLTMNARVRVIQYERSPEGEMALVNGLGWVFQDQLRHIDQPYEDYAGVALAYVGAAYTWASLSSPDCSALVQQVCWACNIPCPRNVSEQIRMLGREVSLDDPDFKYRRGDFVFMFEPEFRPGFAVRHVVIMLDEVNCVHASISGRNHLVVVQPLAKIIEQQFEGTRYHPTMVRRFPLRK